MRQREDGDVWCAVRETRGESWWLIVFTFTVSKLADKQDLLNNSWYSEGSTKGLRDDVEVFKAVSLLHPLDVFIQPVFKRQFI